MTHGWEYEMVLGYLNLLLYWIQSALSYISVDVETLSQMLNAQKKTMLDLNICGLK